MKKYIFISAILGIISLICSVAIAGINLLSSPIIEDNNAKKELEAYQAIYEAYDHSEELNDYESSYIEKKIKALDKDNNELGYLYTVSGKNSFGTIKLIVAINDGKVIQLEFLENGQSYASTVESHVKEFYPTGEDNIQYPLIKPEATPEIGSIDSVDNVNTSCGATFGAELVKTLVNAALEDAKGGI